MVKEQAGSVTDAIRKALREGGTSGGSGIPGELLFVPKDGVKTERFLSEFDEGIPVEMHDKYGKMYPQPCFSYYGKKCPFCEAQGYRTKTQYVWTVYDYESRSKKLFMQGPTQNSALDDLLDIFEKNKTIKDRDIKIVRKVISGKGKYKASELQGQPTPFEVKGVTQAWSKDKVFGVLKGLIAKVKVDPDEIDEEEKAQETSVDPLAAVDENGEGEE